MWAQTLISQALQDVKRTPVSDTFAGLDIQATNFNNLYKNEFFTEVSPIYDFVVILTVFILVLLLICTLPIPVALMCTSLVMFLYFIFTFLMYNHRIGVGLILPGSIYAHCNRIRVFIQIPC